MCFAPRHPTFQVRWVGNAARIQKKLGLINSSPISLVSGFSQAQVEAACLLRQTHGIEWVVVSDGGPPVAPRFAPCHCPRGALPLSACFGPLPLPLTFALVLHLCLRVALLCPCIVLIFPPHLPSLAPPPLPLPLPLFCTPTHIAV